MTARTKSIAIIAAALFSGILIGALAVGAIVNHRIDQLQQLRRPAGFAHVVEDVIRPENREQRAEIRDALRRIAERNVDLRRTMHRQHLALLDSLRSDLSGILTAEQMERLEKWVEHQHRPMGRFMEGRRGPFGGPGRHRERGGMGPPPMDMPPDSIRADVMDDRAAGE